MCDFSAYSTLINNESKEWINYAIYTPKLTQIAILFKSYYPDMFQFVKNWNCWYYYNGMERYRC